MITNIVVLLISCFLFWPNSGCGGEGEGQATPDLSAIQVLDLPTAQQLALAGNPSMEAAMSRVEQARARVQQAAAAWWPSLDMTGSGGRTRQSDTAWQMTRALASLGGQDADQTTEEYAASLQASWLLFDGFYRKFNEEQAGYGEKSAAAAREEAAVAPEGRSAAPLAAEGRSRRAGGFWVTATRTSRIRGTTSRGVAQAGQYGSGR